MEGNMRAYALALPIVLLGAVSLSSSGAAAQGASKEQAQLASALRATHIPLSAGIQAAAATGKPISAKYEYEDGKLQLSVYTEKASQFSEVIVDHQSGKLLTAETILKGDDLKNAQSQSAASGKAKTSLTAAIEKALRANKGYSAVGAAATLKGGQPVAEITLLKGAEFKTGTEPLS